MSHKSEKIWCIIPAAGLGRRLGSDTPKQYLELGREPVLAHSIRVFGQIDAIEATAVGVAPGDPYWRSSGIGAQPNVYSFNGGETRAETVIHGLYFLQSVLGAGDSDWTMVHDAARPLVESEDIIRLLQACQSRGCGGILATGVADTLKRGDENNMITQTEERESLWRALTPQCFPLGILRSAMEQGLKEQIRITDESSAMEHAGYPVQLIPGSSRNFKITVRSDLELARLLLPS